MKITRLSLAAFALTAVGFLSFNAAAAADAAASDGSWVDLATPVYQAFASGRYALTVCLAIILALALVKRYAGSTGAFGRFVHSDAGGSLSALLLGTSTAGAAALAAPGATLTLGILKAGLIAGVVSAGGYAAIKNLVVEPILKPLAAKAPSWAQPVFSLVFWVFDHGPGAAQSAAETTATAAGASAVAAHPAPGAAGIVGVATEVR